MPQKQDNPRIFLSYTRKDADPVEKLYQLLQEAGFYPWMDTKDLLPGEVWETVIQETIKAAPFFVACLWRIGVLCLKYLTFQGKRQTPVK